jgi:transposase
MPVCRAHRNNCRALPNARYCENTIRIAPDTRSSDPATLPRNVTALRSLLLQREDEHAAVLEQQAAERQAARNGLKEQVLRNEQLKLRLAKLLRERFGAWSEKLRGAIEQLELILGDLEEQVAQTTPPEQTSRQPRATTNSRGASLPASRYPRLCRAT